MHDYRDFDTSEERLRSFLVKHGYSRDIIWTFAENYLWDRILYLNVNEIDISRNRDLSKEVCNNSIKYPFGIELSLVTICDDLSMCSIFSPHTELEAESMMISGVKLMIPVRLPPCRRISNRDEWNKLQCKCDRNSSPVADLMSKVEIETSGA